jgi:site-specific DNA recombinase
MSTRVLPRTRTLRALDQAPDQPVRLRVGIYARISEDDKGDEKGVARQIEWGRAMAAEMGDSNPTIYVDNDISAHQTRRRRRDYERLLVDIAAGRLDMVLATHPDRLYRRAADLERLIPLIESSGVSVRTKHAGEVELSTASGKMTARIVGAVAQGEVERMQERQRDKKAAMAEAGEVLGGARPFGYQDGGYELDEAEAEELRDAARRVLAGDSVGEIAADWNRRGVQTARGTTWTGAKVRRVLIRYRNVAIVEHHGEVVGAARWAPVLDEETFAGVRAILGDGKPLTRHRPHVDRLLSGIARCGVCGAVLHGAGQSASGTYRYKCSASQHLKRAAEPIEDYVESVVVGRLARPDGVDLLGTGAGQNRVRELHEQAAAKRAKLDEANAMFLADEIDRAQLRDITARARQALAEIESSLADVARGSVYEGIAGRTDAADVWVGLTLERKRAIIDDLVTVTVHRGKRGGDSRTRSGEQFTSTVDVQEKRSR